MEILQEVLDKKKIILPTEIYIYISKYEPTTLEYWTTKKPTDLVFWYKKALYLEIHYGIYPLKI